VVVAVAMSVATAVAVRAVMTAVAMVGIWMSVGRTYIGACVAFIVLYISNTKENEL
jgi:hypothetical protein